MEDYDDSHERVDWGLSERDMEGTEDRLRRRNVKYKKRFDSL
jgi:hypothetical protein